MIRKYSKSILIVDCEPDISELYAEMLLMDDEKYIVNTAYTGKECLIAIKCNKPDLVLLDVALSDMNGWDLIEQIKKGSKDISIVIITSKPPDINDLGRLSMVSDYLMKPVTLDGLQMAVKDALELPVLFRQCRKNLKNCKDRQESTHLMFLMLKQNIYDRKQYILIRQLYPDRKLENDRATKNMLTNLKGKISRVRNEMNYFKNSGLSFA